jgi:hypothetical protein
MGTIIQQEFDALRTGRLAIPSINPYELGQNERRSFTEFLTMRVSDPIPEEQLNWRFEELRAWIREIANPKNPNPVYFDTTTIYTAAELILNKEKGGGKVTPATLLDLSNFVTSVVLRDRIFFLSNEILTKEIIQEKINGFLGETVLSMISIPRPRDGYMYSDSVDSKDSMYLLLEGLWSDTDNYIQLIKNNQHEPNSFGEEAKTIKKNWRELLDFKANDALWFDATRDVKNSAFSTKGNALLEELVSIYQSAMDRPTIEHLQNRGRTEQVTRATHRIIDECNYRGMFHSQVSDCLDLPYLPNSFRLPFHNYYRRRSKKMSQLMISLQSVDLNQTPSSARAVSTLKLPLFLAGILERIDSLDQFFDILADMRKEASKFRAYMAEMEVELRAGRGEKLQKLEKALKTEAKSLWKFLPAGVGSIGFGLLAATFTTTLWWAFGAILAGASVFSPDLIDTVRQKVGGRRFRFVINNKKMADSLTSSYSKIHTLWSLGKLTNPPTEEYFVRGFERLMKVN